MKPDVGALNPNATVAAKGDAGRSPEGDGRSWPEAAVLTQESGGIQQKGDALREPAQTAGQQQTLLRARRDPGACRYHPEGAQEGPQPGIFCKLRFDENAYGSGDPRRLERQSAKRSPQGVA